MTVGLRQECARVHSILQLNLARTAMLLRSVAEDIMQCRGMAKAISQRQNGLSLHTAHSALTAIHNGDGVVQ